MLGQLEGSACPELIPGEELLALHRLKVAVCPGGMQLPPSRGQMGWRVAGDAPLSSLSPWLLPVRLCQSCCPAGLGGKPAAQEKPGAAQAVAGGRMEEANPPGVSGLCHLPRPFCIPVQCPGCSGMCQNPCSALSPKHQLPGLPPSTLAKYFGHSAISLASLFQCWWYFWGVSSHLLQNGAFSFPYGQRAADCRGKEMITRALLRLGWSQLTWEDEELTSHWALPLLNPFLEQTFHGDGQGKADWGFGFFPSQEPLRH